MIFHRAFGRMLVLGGGFAMVFAAASSQAESKAWDQKQVTQLARDLSAAAVQLATQNREAPAPEQPLEDEDSQLNLEYYVRLIRSEAGHLYEELKKGAGAKETRPVYRHLQELAGRAGKAAKALRATFEVEDALDAVDKSLERLAPYYAKR